MNADQLDWLTERVLGAVFEVTNTLGAGCLRKVYQRAVRALPSGPLRPVRNAWLWMQFDELNRFHRTTWLGPRACVRRQQPLRLAGANRRPHPHQFLPRQRPARAAPPRTRPRLRPAQPKPDYSISNRAKTTKAIPGKSGYPSIPPRARRFSHRNPLGRR